MYNTIILLKGEERLTRNEYKNFKKGDTILGIDAVPEELKRFKASDEAAALEELNKYRCSYYQASELIYVEEYALEFCECDEEGEFIEGSDYEMAPELKDL